jgi:hypothetical protein
VLRFPSVLHDLGLCAQYDAEHKHDGMMEHVPSFSAFVEELRKSLV